jgi:hypothetical protein
MGNEYAKSKGYRNGDGREGPAAKGGTLKIFFSG